MKLKIASKNPIVGTDGGQSQQILCNFLQSLKVTSHFCKSGSGSAKINADSQPCTLLHYAVWTLF